MLGHCRTVFSLASALTLLCNARSEGQQVADSTFDVSVSRPAHTRRHPVVVIDDAHQNFHTADGRYAPFANLLRNDGYRVDRATQPITPQRLAGVHVFVISNARADTTSGQAPYALTEQECDVLRDWVRAGGALLFVADHAPFGAATENLARRFGVEFGKGFVYDSTASLEGAPMNLVFSAATGTLGDHSILFGRDSLERVHRVIAFTGQSMTVPPGAAPLLRLSDAAREAPTRDDVWERKGSMVRGRAQGVALSLGSGRVVILGEAAVLSAQIARWEEDGKQHELAMGMNHPGSDNKQFALNILRWLTRVLP